MTTPSHEKIPESTDADSSSTDMSSIVDVDRDAAGLVSESAWDTNNPRVRALRGWYERLAGDSSLNVLTEVLDLDRRRDRERRHAEYSRFEAKVTAALKAFEARRKQFTVELEAELTNALTRPAHRGNVISEEVFDRVKAIIAGRMRARTRRSALKNPRRGRRLVVSEDSLQKALEGLAKLPETEPALAALFEPRRKGSG